MDIKKYIEKAQSMEISAAGENSKCYLFSDNALLHGSYAAEHLNTLKVESEKLWDKGMNVPKVIDYQFVDQDMNKKYRECWLLETRVPGKALHELNPYPLIFRPTTKEEVIENYQREVYNTEAYERELELLSQVPQDHYDKFLEDMLLVANHPFLCYDGTYASNFQYDREKGFGFVDLTPRHVIDSPDFTCQTYLKILLGKGEIIKEHQNQVQSWIDQILAKAYIAMKNNKQLNELYSNPDDLKTICYTRQFRRLGFLLSSLPNMEDYIERSLRTIEMMRELNLIDSTSKKI